MPVTCHLVRSAPLPVDIYGLLARLIGPRVLLVDRPVVADSINLRLLTSQEEGGHWVGTTAAERVGDEFAGWLHRYLLHVRWLQVLGST